MRVYLIGFMGAGKTTVGRLLAPRLEARFLDLDRRVEESAGSSVAEIFAQRGEEVFRDLESAALAETAALDPAVVATGGGILGRSANRELLRRLGVTVWLNVPFETLEHRLDAAARRVRPLFARPALARELFEARRPRYRSCDLEIRVAAADSPQRTADDVREALARL